MKYVVGLTGSIGAGKTVVSDYLHDRYGAAQLRYSQILMDVLDRLALRKDRRNLQVLGEMLRKSFGEEVLVNAFKRDLEGCDADVVVIDGIRYGNEVEMLRRLENNVLLFINAPAEIRYGRVLSRGEKGEARISFKEFLKAEKSGTEREIPAIKKVSDYVIENDSSIESLYPKVDAALKEKLRIKPHQ